MRTMSRRQVLTAVFQDTQEFYTDNAELKAAIDATKTGTVRPHTRSSLPERFAMEAAFSESISTKALPTRP